MSAEVIVKKILDKAAEDAANAKEQGERLAAEQADAIIKAARQQATVRLEKARAEAADIQRREELMTRLQLRKDTLQAKRDVMDQVFAAARLQLEQLEDTRLAALFSKLVLENADAGDTIVRVYPALQQKLREASFGGHKGLLEELSRQLTDEKKAPCRLLLDDAAAEEGGIWLITDKADMDLSFDALLSQVRASDEAAVAALLFDEGKAE